MKPVAFNHICPGTLNEASDRLADTEGDVKIVAGGQSLGPMLNLRLARPVALVDVSALAELQLIQENDGTVIIGAATRHADIEDGRVPEPIPAMLQYVASGIAYRAVRNKGTIGGSLCHADPAADWVTAMTALNASLVIKGTLGDIREVPMMDFMHGAYRTDLGEGEILHSVSIPKYPDQARWGYYKICRKTGEFADAIAAFVADPSSKYCRVVFGAVSGTPLISARLAVALAETGKAPDLCDIKAELAILDPELSDIKTQQLAIAFQRCVAEALNSD
jgi:carbon-monoxide dehydrogenase medium subunit